MAVLQAAQVSHPLLGRPITAVLTTALWDGRLQSSPVWFAPDGEGVVVSTMLEFAKARNLKARPFATLLVVNPDDTTDWVELRARVTLDETDALSVLDDIGERYTGLRPYFGAVVPASLAATEHPVTCRLTPVSMTTQPAVSGPPRRLEPTPNLPRAVGCRDDLPLPVDHLDLLDAPLVGVLATRLPSGFAQTQPVWFARDGSDLLVNTTLERRKGRNLLDDPRATLLVIDPADASRWIEVRADADLTTDEAEEQLDRLTRAYTSHDHYYGGVYPVARRAQETRVIARLHPRAVRCDAIHR